ncbi:uncharacterized protein F5Z01DRAFT_99648 [Emericellopsis atlantica]|uniref:Uncharacterized protein n=1 Tax=Emericellopsis atlantica TaxID=2614577 RepID=A0A9P8CP81_9HYPO|nr:uncharacterized protein F5Z01DRAFT_99648 [Emericellopsis atlantica]KAG9254263.1 hypothetical protein F5Z01DRAFT_99648 [Emericellopsis atlantica]
MIYLERGRDDSSFPGTTGKFRRFVLFAYHPQRMLYGRQIALSKTQDLVLEVASKLSGIDIDRQFYQVTHRPGTYGKLATWQRKIQIRHNTQAIREVMFVAGKDVLEGSDNTNTARAPQKYENFTELDTPLDIAPEAEEDLESRPEKTLLAMTPEPRQQLLTSPSELLPNTYALQHLATALMRTGASQDQALIITGLGASMALDDAAITEWADIPSELQD